MVSVSASVNLPLHHEVQKFSSGTGSPGWSRKKGRKTVVCVYEYLSATICASAAKQQGMYEAGNRPAFTHSCAKFVRPIRKHKAGVITSNVFG